LVDVISNILGKLSVTTDLPDGGGVNQVEVTLHEFSERLL
jgi:hypothetical protein